MGLFKDQARDWEYLQNTNPVAFMGYRAYCSVPDKLNSLVVRVCYGG